MNPGQCLGCEFYIKMTNYKQYSGLTLHLGPDRLPEVMCQVKCLFYLKFQAQVMLEVNPFFNLLAFKNCDPK